MSEPRAGLATVHAAAAAGEPHGKTVVVARHPELRTPEPVPGPRTGAALCRGADMPFGDYNFRQMRIWANFGTVRSA
ncbi:hypothetical protein [Catenuloplanes atrovinosus]|uniref:Uncharacterized protein n=1 Tax=Catenuloplanes atrovinosus TaxID=137266 RepID=A0AAE3YR33_9ACTN|nr:hypothetical protein [Catenuloplanes atrovinosus]MDR7277096.1 hypothetical protein [Catenuloplanes atrovinosus]